MRLALLAVPLAVAALAGCAPRLAPMSPAAPLPDPGLYTLTDAPQVGIADGVIVREGGISGLDRLADGTLIGVTDRGPNIDAATSEGRPSKRFPVPGYHPSIVTLRLDDDRIEVVSRVPILTPDGGAVSGRPPAGSQPGDVDVTITETATGADNLPLEPDPWGLDAEGIADAGDGTVWLCEEYRPSLWHVDRATGRVLGRVVPRPELRTDFPLPLVFRNRTANRGFEGIAVVRTARGVRVVAVSQGPMTVPGGSPVTPIARLLVFDPASGQAETRAFALDGHDRRIGDIAALPDGRVLVIEQGVTETGGAWSAHLYALDLMAGRAVDDGQPPETYATEAEARGAGVALVPKLRVADLLAAGWPPGARKPEGLVIDGRRVIVTADNDYGIDSAAGDGRAAANGRETVALVFDLPTAP